MKDRILKFLQAENKTSSQLAEEIGVQPSGISHILSGRNKPSLDFVIRMLERYDFLSMEWLIFGRGDMYKSGTPSDLFSQMNGSGKGIDDNDTEAFSPETSIISEGKEASSPVPDGVDMGNANRQTERIIWFYSDNTYREFKPGNKNSQQPE